MYPLHLCDITIGLSDNDNNYRGNAQNIMHTKSADFMSITAAVI